MINKIEIDGKFEYVEVDGVLKITPEIVEPPYDPLEEITLRDTKLYTNKDLDRSRANHTPFQRTPDDGEAKKVSVLLHANATIKIGGIPKYRRVPDDSARGYKLVQNWETEADKNNLEKDYVFAPDQPFFMSNEKDLQFPQAFDPPGKYWDGGYLKLKYLKGTIEIPPELPEIPIPTDSQIYVVPDDGETYWQMLHDFENPHWNYLPRSHYVNKNYRKFPPANALPETVQFKKDEFFPLSESFQLLYFELFKHAADGYMSDAELLTAWREFAKDHIALFDNNAWDNGNIDYNLGENLGDEKGEGVIRQKALGFGGGIVKQVMDMGTEVVIEAIDPTTTVPDIEDIWGKWHLVGWATQETMTELAWDAREKPTMWRVSPFPHIRQGGWKSGTPYLLLGKDGLQTIEKNRLKPITNGETYSPHIRNA
jgi:hypothetical protein